MKFTAVTSLFIAGTALAAPLTTERHARNEARQAERRRTSPPLSAVNGQQLHFNGTKNVEYSSNWAGAVLIGTGYTKVTGTFTVPTPSVPSGGRSNEEYCASAWVGIDGDTCSTSILQTSVDFCVQGSSVSYDAWYEWYPDYAYDFSGISISAGDVITVTVDASSPSAGTATVENVSTGQTVTHTFSGETDELCEYNAEWIVEDFESNGSLVPFADFGTVTFSGATATDDGSTVGPSGATILDIEQNNRVLTSVSVAGSDVTITYE
ncbi:hypothetical protein DTO169C6_7112 [Paecilomyces variotii]|nr:hypothetical protein DTO169C6_7112 [Paecilomyces variotii]